MWKTWIITNNLFWVVLIGAGLVFITTYADIPDWVKSSAPEFLAGYAGHFTAIAVLTLIFCLAIFSWVSGLMIARLNFRYLRPFIQSSEEFKETLFEDEALSSQQKSRRLVLSDRLTKARAYQKPWLVWIDLEGARFSDNWMLTNNIHLIDEYQGAGLTAHTFWIETRDAWMIDLSKLLVDSGARSEVFGDLMSTLARLRLLDAVVLPLSININTWEVDNLSFDAMMEFVNRVCNKLNMQIPVVWLIRDSDKFPGLISDDEVLVTVWSEPIESHANMSARINKINHHFDAIYADQMSSRSQQNARNALQNMENLRRLRASLVRHYMQWSTHLPKAFVRNIVFARQQRIQQNGGPALNWSHGALILETSVPYSFLERFKLNVGKSLVALILFGSLFVGSALTWKWDQARKVEASFQLVVDRLNESAHHLRETDILEAIKALEQACLECSIEDVHSANSSIQLLWRSLLNSVLASYVQRSLEIDFANVGLSHDQLFGRLLAYYQLGMGIKANDPLESLLGHELMRQVWKTEELAQAWDALVPLGIAPRPISNHSLDAVRSELSTVTPAQRILWLISHFVDRKLLASLATIDFNLIFAVDQSYQSIDNFYTSSGYELAFKPSLQQMSHLIGWDNQLMNGSLDSVRPEEIVNLYLQSFEAHWNTLSSRLKVRSPKDYAEWVLQLNNLTDFQMSSLRQVAELARSQLESMQIDTQRWEKNLLDVGQLSEMLAHFRAELRRANDATENRGALFEWLKAQFVANDVNLDRLALLEKAASEFEPEMSAWVLALVKQWRALILQECGQYANEQFKKELWVHYESLILGRFPFFESDEDVSLKNFIRYFGHQGFEKVFFDSYVMPFVNVHHQPWSIKSLGAYRLPLSDETLKNFYRAQVIRSSMFEHDSDELTPLSVSLAGELGVDRMLEIGWDSHIVRLSDDESDWQLLPRTSGNSKSQGLIRIVGEDNNQALLTTGTWSWLKLLNLGHIEVTGARNRILITFEPHREIVRLNIDGEALDQVMEYKLFHRYRLSKSLLDE